MGARNGGKPLVPVVSSVPMLSEAVAAALEQSVRVAWFAPIEGALAGLLRSLAADIVVVDSRRAAEEAASLAHELDLTVVDVALRKDEVRVLRNGVWTDAGDASTHSIRNVLAAALFGKEAIA
jgi:hypothetical protein